MFCQDYIPSLQWHRTGSFQDDEICFKNKATYLFAISSYNLVRAVISFKFNQEDKFKFNTTQLRVIGGRT